MSANIHLTILEQPAPIVYLTVSESGHKVELVLTEAPITTLITIESQGSQGPQGEQGPQGDPGIQGIQGLTGEDGDPGIDGFPGIDGDKGDKGDTGAQGIQGIQGIKGDQGEQGEPGTDGAPGEPGTNGAPGAKGDQGDTGAQGIQGLKGDKGDQGIQGLKGDDGVSSYTQTETFEESAPLTASSFQWGVGNGDEIEQDGGVPSAFDGAIRKLYFHIVEGSATIEIYVNGTASGVTISASGTNASTVSTINVPISEGDLINFRTTVASGNTNGGRVGFLSSATGAPESFSINEASDVDISGITDGQTLRWNATSSQFEVVDFSSSGTIQTLSIDGQDLSLSDGGGTVTIPSSGGGGTDAAAVGAIAAGSTLGLQQSLLANAGQPALTVLAVGYTTSGKVQGVSLGDGNVIEVYANGTDFNAGTVLYREFMALGEPIVFTGLSNGAIITSTQGFYGVSEQVDGQDESPMPLLSYGLSFKSTFFFGFRNCQNYTGGSSGNDQGWVHVVNGPLESSVTFKFGNGNVVQGQQDITVPPWGYQRLYTSGNTEYIIESTNPVMACHNAAMDNSFAGKFYDSRLIMPLTNDGITWPRSGNVSAPYNGTVVNYYVRDNAQGTFTVSPGSPVNYQNATGADDQDYEPNGATRALAVGLISAYSGADSAGLEASPMMPTSAMSQIVALPFTIQDNGDGGDNGVAIASPYAGTAKVYSWNGTGLTLEYTVPLTRNGVTITSKEDQKHPSAGAVANDSVDGVVALVGTLSPGIVIADVPITVVTQTSDSGSVQLRSQNGTTATQIVQNDDETLMLGWTPATLKAEITEGSDGILYRRAITGGTDTWEIA